jgi:hypothetical protein
MTQGEGPGETRGRQVGAETGEGAGGGANGSTQRAGAARDAVGQRFEYQVAERALQEGAEQGTSVKPAVGSPAKLTAAERRLQESIRRIEAERSRRASAATLWRPAAPRPGESRDW